VSTHGAFRQCNARAASYPASSLASARTRRFGCRATQPPQPPRLPRGAGKASATSRCSSRMNAGAAPTRLGCCWCTCSRAAMTPTMVATVVLRRGGASSTRRSWPSPVEPCSSGLIARSAEASVHVGCWYSSQVAARESARRFRFIGAGRVLGQIDWSRGRDCAARRPTTGRSMRQATPGESRDRLRLTADLSKNCGLEAFRPRGPRFRCERTDRSKVAGIPRSQALRYQSGRHEDMTAAWLLDACYWFAFCRRRSPPWERTPWLLTDGGVGCAGGW